MSSSAFFFRFDDFSLDFALVPPFFFLFLSFTMFVFFDMSFWIRSSFSVSDLWINKDQESWSLQLPTLKYYSVSSKPSCLDSPPPPPQSSWLCSCFVFYLSSCPFSLSLLSLDLPHPQAGSAFRPQSPWCPFWGVYERGLDNWRQSMITLASKKEWERKLKRPRPLSSEGSRQACQQVGKTQWEPRQTGIVGPIGNQVGGKQRKGRPMLLRYCSQSSSDWKMITMEMAKSKKNVWMCSFFLLHSRGLEDSPCCTKRYRSNMH